jgi:hypothetical protein
MIHAATDTRIFGVHAQGLSTHHPRLVEERSFEAAAVAFAENLHIAGDDQLGDLSIIVRDVETGHEHCFRIDLMTGDAATCN